MRSIASISVVVILAVYGAYLGSTNLEQVTLHLGFTNFGPALWQALLGSLMAGVAGIVLAFGWPVIRMRLTLRRQARQIRELEQEIHGLRTLPLIEDEAAETATAREG
ncbi:MAG: LapA family protein [Myxococcales bacterium]|nr:LapA family protein [Myxococcales bacterium]